MIGNITKKGFSLFEMVIVVGILGIIAMASVPVAEMTLTNAKETVLEENLERIREAIALWKRDCRNAVVRQYGYDNLNKVPDYKLYPPSLEALVHCENRGDGVYVDSEGREVSRICDSTRKQVATFTPQKYLDYIPEDPFVGRPCWYVHYATGRIDDLTRNPKRYLCGAYNFLEPNKTRAYTEKDYERGNGLIDPEPTYLGVFDVSCMPSISVDSDEYYTRRGFNVSVDGTRYEDW